MKKGWAGLAALAALVSVAGLDSTVASAAVPSTRIEFVTGSATVDGRPARVDMAVLVRAGEDEASVTRAALASAGATPVTSDDPDFALNGLQWPQFFDADPANDFVVQQYNPAGDATGNSVAAEAAVANAEATWTAVPDSAFAYQYGGLTSAGPGFDQVNVVAWQPDWQSDPNALALTISVFQISTGDLLDSDIVLNSEDFTWSADPAGPAPGEADLETVLLHEDGHAFGLDHSSDPTAVMFAFYNLGTTHRSLAPDDIAAITTLYPGEPTTGCTSQCLRSTAITMSAQRVPRGFAVSAGVRVQDEHGRLVGGAKVTVEWSLPNGSTATATATTNQNGIARFTVVDGRGTYTVTVTAIKRSSYTFDPANSTLTATLTV